MIQKILRGYIFRLYPTKEQATLIDKTIGCSRFIYNYSLKERLNKKITNYEQIKNLPNLFAEYKWLNEIDKNALYNSIKNVDRTITNYENGLIDIVKFKSKDKYNVYQTTYYESNLNGKLYRSIKIDFKNHLISLPKIKNIKYRGYKKKTNLQGNIKSAVIRRTAGRYYISLLVAEEIVKPEFIPRSIVGLDLGIKNIIVTSYNEKIENSLECTNIYKRIKGLQKGLNRCQPGSKNRYKLKLKIQRLYLKLKNIHKSLIHAITNKIVNYNDIIVMEDLDILEMYQKRSMAKHLIKIPLAEIKKVLRYKCNWQNKKLITINRYYPSSQICSRCGYQNKLLKNLKIRNWTCPSCGAEHDRDINASLNILFEGLKVYINSLF